MKSEIKNLIDVLGKYFYLFLLGLKCQKLIE